MTLDEVVSKLKECIDDPDWLWEESGRTALNTAITLIQDYQKLRERVSVEGIKKVIRKPFIIKRDMQELGYHSKGTVDYISWREDIGEWGDENLAQAIVTYLQQPTEHIAR